MKLIQSPGQVAQILWCKLRRRPVKTSGDGVQQRAVYLLESCKCPGGVGQVLGHEFLNPFCLPPNSLKEGRMAPGQPGKGPDRIGHVLMRHLRGPRQALRGNGLHQRRVEGRHGRQGPHRVGQALGAELRRQLHRPPQQTSHVTSTRVEVDRGQGPQHVGQAPRVMRPTHQLQNSSISGETPCIWALGKTTKRRGSSHGIKLRAALPCQAQYCFCRALCKNELPQISLNPGESLGRAQRCTARTGHEATMLHLDMSIDLRCFRLRRLSKRCCRTQYIPDGAPSVGIHVSLDFAVTMAIHGTHGAW